LEPVRQHFTNNARAKELLALVQQYKKESGKPFQSTPRRLNLVALNKVPANAHLVLAPLPVAEPTLQDAMNVVTQLRQGSSSDVSPALLLSDWTARVCNAVGADIKTITAFYHVFLASCRALDPSLMEKVTVVWQSEAILTDPSNYWISVINTGRHFMLDKVMGPSMKDSDGVGQVIGRLMMVADVAGLEPASLALTPGEAAATEMEMIHDFFPNKLPGVTVPVVTTVAAPSLRLQVERDSEALKTPNDEYFLLDDPKVHGKSKLKKAFCEPGNVEFCPPISLAGAFAFEKNEGSVGSLTISRKPENGGDKTYTSLPDLQADFASGALHPGDLKTAVSTLAVGVLDDIATALKTDKEIQQAVKALKNYQKKAAKAKK
jgi:tyrosyl-tRNA synthetase